MRKCIAMCLLVVFLGCGSNAFAADSDCDCNCRKGGLGIKIGKFVVGFGVRKFNTKLGCNNQVGLFLGLGSETAGFGLGFGYNDGVIGIGFGLRGPETTTSMGLGIGYDYGDCRMVWPIEE
jgi:hypothetical protein